MIEGIKSEWNSLNKRERAMWSLGLVLVGLSTTLIGVNIYFFIWTIILGFALHFHALNTAQQRLFATHIIKAVHDQKKEIDN